jgi:ATP-binding cassette subfamily B protein
MIDMLLAPLMSCGPRALRRAALARGGRPRLSVIRRIAGTDRRGTSLAGLARAAAALGFDAVAARADYAGAIATGAPFIAHLRVGHFVLVESVTADGVRLAGAWRSSVSRRLFERRWSGVLLALRPEGIEGGGHD